MRGMHKKINSCCGGHSESRALASAVLTTVVALPSTPGNLKGTRGAVNHRDSLLYTTIFYNSPQHQSEDIAMTLSKPLSWSRDSYYISSDKNLLSLPAINAAFAQPWMYWTQSFPEATLQDLIDNSFCLGLYKTSTDPVDVDSTRTATAGEQIGFSRLVTDNVTFAYLTDIYVLPEYQGLGLGTWLIECTDEVLRGMPVLRWAMLRTSGERSIERYKKRLGMDVLSSDPIQGPAMMGRRGGGWMV